MYSPSRHSPPPSYFYEEIRPQSYIFTTPEHVDDYRPTKTSYMRNSTSETRPVNKTYVYSISPRTTSHRDPPKYTSSPNIKRSSTYPGHSESKSHSDKRKSYVISDSFKAQLKKSSSKKERSQSYTQSRTTTREFIVKGETDDVYGYDYSPRGSPPPPYHEAGYEDGYWTSRYVNSEKMEKEKSRKPVKSSAANKSRTSLNSTSSSSKSKKTSSSKTSSSSKHKYAKATATDAARAGIPAGYSYKNWDPTEEPIFLLGSVFDANSLGKWIYDWTVYHHGPSTPMADMAGDLWLLLIQLAGKIKRADACMPRIRHRSDRELIDEFLESGDRLWDRLTAILKACEDWMWHAAKKERAASGAGVAMGANSGTEFVETMFGRDRKLDDTEKLMASMRLWNMRFDTNCEVILRHPSG